MAQKCDENLVPFDKLTEEEQRKIRKKGGVASVAARRRKKTMRETFEAILDMPIKNGKATDIEKIRSIAETRGKNITVQDAINLSIAQKAVRGDVKAAEFIRDTIGEKPSDVIDINTPTIIDDSKSLKD